MIYNWETNVGAAGLTCTIPAGKLVNPLDWTHVPHEVQTRLKERKATRAKALKEWRTMSCALHHYTNKSIDEFDIPGSCCIRPQLPTESRLDKVIGGRNRSFLKDIDGYYEKEVLPPS